VVVSTGMAVDGDVFKNVNTNEESMKNIKFMV